MAHIATVNLRTTGVLRWETTPFIYNFMGRRKRDEIERIERREERKKRREKEEKTREKRRRERREDERKRKLTYTSICTKLRPPFHTMPSSGYLGCGSDNDEQLIPQQISSLSGRQITRVSCGPCFSFALASSESGRSEVLVWGDNSKGQLGLGHKENVTMPTLVEELANHAIVNLSCGTWHVCAITGKLTCCL